IGRRRAAESLVGALQLDRRTWKGSATLVGDFPGDPALESAVGRCDACRENECKTRNQSEDETVLVHKPPQFSSKKACSFFGYLEGGMARNTPVRADANYL